MGIVVTAIISMVLLALNAYAKDVDPGQMAEKQKKDRKRPLGCP